jgi:hypothetical protein
MRNAFAAWRAPSSPEFHHNDLILVVCQRKTVGVEPFAGADFGSNGRFTLSAAWKYDAKAEDGQNRQNFA